MHITLCKEKWSILASFCKQDKRLQNFNGEMGELRAYKNSMLFDHCNS